MSKRAQARPEVRTRTLADTDFTIRAVPDAAPVFTGHAAVFNQRTAIGNPFTWGFYEEVAPGAFTKTLSEGDARFLVDHDTSLIVARKSAGDLRLTEDSIGLDTEADLDQEVSYVRDLTRNVEKRRITGMSFGFMVVKDDWTSEEVETSTGDPIEVEVRTIREVQLLEVSAVTFPAYEQTDAAIRSLVLSAKMRRGTLTDADVRKIHGLPKRDADTDTDDDPNAIIAAVDAAIDEALDLHAAGEDEQAWALITAADISVDAVLALLGIPDPDDDARSRKPAKATRGNRTDEPVDATRLSVAALRRRQNGLAALYGITP